MRPKQSQGKKGTDQKKKKKKMEEEEDIQEFSSTSHFPKITSTA